ncbi:MAG: DegT/DnrJ/EryC1/StrS family aminotransferase [Myxococcota bacterium]|nr:DegT/DnrJ/EryC1/StrS family aminotransferase [Myxococcota bacterium]
MSRPVPFVDLVRLHDPLRGELVEAFEAVLLSGRYHLGPQTEAFEQDFAVQAGAESAVGCGSGSDALFLALRAYDIGPGDLVATVSNSFMATAESIVRTGARVVFADVDPLSRCMDPEDLSRLLAEPGAQALRAIIPVHLYGRQADIPALRAVLEAAGREDVEIIGDAAQAHGSPGVSTQTILSCYSFYPAKNLGALGDAGLVVCRDEALAQRIRQLRNHGRAKKHSVDEVGLNSRFDELQAAVLRIKLRHLDEHNALRREAAAAYRDRLAGLPGLELPEDTPEHVYHLYVVELERGRRDTVLRALRDEGIGVGLHYPLPVHAMAPYPSDRPLPVTERLASSVLSLPIFPGIRLDEVELVCNSLKKVLLDGER